MVGLGVTYLLSQYFCVVLGIARLDDFGVE
jgi:hypothetical protein